MPSTQENLTKMWSSNESLYGGSSTSSGFHSPGSPTASLSPLSTSPTNTLRRTGTTSSRHKKKKQLLIKSGSIESFVIHSDCRDSRSQSPLHHYQTVNNKVGGREETENDDEEAEKQSIFVRLIGWYPCFLFKILRAICLTILPQTSWKQLIIAIPMFWISLWIWFFGQLIKLPLNAIKFLLSLWFTTALERTRKKRTILISGGSTIQALHLARNFHSAGARVIVCEIEGYFALARYSTAVSQFYTLPKPTHEHQQQYVRALCDIVSKENCLYYIPVCATTTAYYDAVAKPHLELLGCNCFTLGLREVRAFDDIMELLKCCERYRMPAPWYHVVTSMKQLHDLYDTGVIRCCGKFFMQSAGVYGIKEKLKVVLPPTKTELKMSGDLINEQRPWVVMRDCDDDDDEELGGGNSYLTCTTLKESKVIANCTCRLMEDGGLQPVEHRGITEWLRTFIGNMNFVRCVNGHVSFRLFVRQNGDVLLLNGRIGISLPYILYTNQHPRFIWRNCKHLSMNGGGSGVGGGTMMNADSIVGMINGCVLDKREVLFTIWDPLPYCAYYHIQLPFRNFLGFVRRTQHTFQTPMTAAVN